MRRLPLLLLALAALAAATPRLAAQTIRWDPPGGTLPVGEVSSLRLVFEGCSPDGVPKFPAVDGLTLEYRGQSSTMSLVNGTFSRSVEMAVAALLDKNQAVDIPAFVVSTNDGPIHVAPAHFNPSGATVGSTGVAISDAATARLVPSSASVWAGEVFTLNYSIDVAASYSPSWGRGVFSWDPAPLVAEDWSLPEPYDNRAGGRTGLRYHARALAPEPGHIELKPTSQLLALAVGVSGFGFFQQRQYQEFAVPDGPVAIDVRPLPPAPAGFGGAVGGFAVSAKVVPQAVKVGEPITWTVKLTGSGNWPQIRGLPSREAPADFQVIQPKPKRTQPSGQLFEGTLEEDVVLVATKPGDYDLPPVDFVFFDPQSGAYRTSTAPGAHVTVEAAAPVSAAAPVAPAPGVPAVTATGPEAKVPEEPSGTLGDPLAASPPAHSLVRRRTEAVVAGAAFALAAALWIVLATLRARVTDPNRARRAARLRLLGTLEGLRSAPAAQRPTLLLAWQHDSAVLWGVSHAAPPAAAFPDGEWAQLWSEADRFLYGTGSPLPADWGGRAHAALERKPVPAVSPLAFLLPRNLLPLVAAACLAAAPALRADPADLYRRGDFPAAEKGWNTQVAANPLDWSARHNLSLALAQQDRWGEAAAQATAAFVQNPASPATRRQVTLACDKAGFTPEPVDGLLQPGPVTALATLQSPGDWQRTGVGAAAALAAALALTLLAAYRKLGRWATALACVLVVLAAAAGLASWVSLHAYGIGADRRAVVVWRTGVLRSLPSEADVNQKTTPLAAGSTAVVDRTYLRWVRLAFPNGQGGWVPESELVSLWQAPPR